MRSKRCAVQNQGITLRTTYHNRMHTQTILSCMYHSVLTRLVRKTMQLRQWSNAYRLYDRG